MRFLVVDDRENYRKLISQQLHLDDQHKVDLATCYADAVEELAKNSYDVVCLNLNIPSKNGKRYPDSPFPTIQLLKIIKTEYPRTQVIMITAGRQDIEVLGGENKFKGELGVKHIEYKGKIGEQERFLKRFLIGLSQSLVSEPRHNDNNTKLEGEKPMVELDKNKQGITSSAHLHLPVVHRTVSWLHISDLHIGRNDRIDSWKALSDALVHDIEQNVNYESATEEEQSSLAGIPFKPDLLLITGDIANKGKQEEYKAAEELMKKIFSSTGLRKSRTFVVPGNHDVDRSICEEDYVYKLAYEKLALKYGSPNEYEQHQLEWSNNDYLKALVEKKFFSYREFSKKCSNARLNNNLSYTQVIKLQNGINVRITGINSSLLSWKNGEEGTLHIGQTQINQLRPWKQSADFNILLVHHPEEAIHEQDRDTWHSIESTAHVLCHGHQHTMKIKSMSEPGNEHLLLQAGALNAEGKYHKQRYTYCVYNFDLEELTVYMRATITGRTPSYVQDVESYARTPGFKNGVLTKTFKLANKKPL